MTMKTTTETETKTEGKAKTTTEAPTAGAPTKSRTLSSFALLALSSLAWSACASQVGAEKSPSDAGADSLGSGGAVTGGRKGTGGSAATGGQSSTGGGAMTGGRAGTGGLMATGGRMGGTGAPGTGGTSQGGSSGGASGTHPGFYVSEGRVYDACGERVVLRGVNRMAIYNDPAGKSYPEIAKTGANAVRVMWMTDANVSSATFAGNLKAAVDAKLIPVPGLWDATGDFSKMAAVEAWWTSPAVVGVVKQYTDKMIVNIANEAGAKVADTDWVTTYNRIITHMRQVGIHALIAVDASGFGRNVEQLLSLAPQILEADPDHNVLFDWHEYDGGSSQNARITKAFDTAASQHLALMVGEFANGGAGACSQAIPYNFLIAEAQRVGVGYFPWSWDNFNSDCEVGGDSLFNMVTDPLSFASLRPGWATEVCLSDPNSIQKTSVRPRSLTAGRCQ